MCGDHSEHPMDHHHVRRPLGRVRARQLHRRAFLGYFGGGTAALAILGPVAAACSSGSTADQAATTTTTAAASTTSATDATSPDPTTTADAAGEPGRWARVQLGSVSAFVLARGSEVAVVDTGNPGSADAIGQTISDLGLTYSNVRHVALTHAHPDHIGSIDAVLEMAGNATAYAGANDVANISADLVAVGDGDEILGMQVIDTPGHTAGHISLFDPLTSTLVAGDSMNGADGGVTGANPRFTPDMATADESIRKMAQLQFDTVYFGHGEPVLTGAGVAVADLAAQL